MAIADQPLATTDAARQFPPRRVYAVVGVPPEVQAYAMAKYSRSSQGMLESIQELSLQQAAAFLNTFYFQYGHRSIADLAHLVFGVEQVSLLAAIELVDEQVWDGQERSTRYQPFRKTGWYTPTSLAQSPSENAGSIYNRTASALFSTYEQLTDRLLEHLVEAVPRPADLSDGAFRRTLRARAFDVSRSLLPMATHTSVGQVVSARILERQVGRLLGSAYPEIRELGEALREACDRAPEAPLHRGPGDEGDVLLTSAAAPTLVKYAAASAYQQSAAAALREAALMYLEPVGEPDRSRSVDLVDPPTDPVVEIAATLLYRFDPVGRSYRQAVEAAGALSEARRQEIMDLSLRDRGRHDDLLREHQVGYRFAFDVLVDIGSFRDLHRHRRCVQVRQPYTWSHGFDRAEDVFQAGLGARAALAALEEGLGDLYAESLLKAEAAADAVSAADPVAADYLRPLAYRARCLFKMDWAQAVYMIEQRTAPAGHFSYRRAAWGMFEALRERHPALAAPIRAVDPYGPVDLLNR